MATYTGIDLIAGDTRIVSVTARDEAGDPVDLTDAAIVYLADPPVAIEKSVGDGIAITDPPAGRFEIHFSAEDTLGIVGRTFAAHQCRLLTREEEILTAFYGIISVVHPLAAR